MRKEVDVAGILVVGAAVAVLVTVAAEEAAAIVDLPHLPLALVQVSWAGKHEVVFPERKQAIQSQVPAESR